MVPTGFDSSPGPTPVESSVPIGQRRFWPNPALLWLVLYLIACMVSITAAQVLLVIAAVGYLGLAPHRISRGIQAIPGYFWMWNLLFLGWTLLSVTWALEPGRAWRQLWKLPFWIGMVLVAEVVCSLGDRARRAVVLAVAAAGTANAVWALVQFGQRRIVGLEARLTGFQGHYMTLGGILTIAIVWTVAATTVWRKRGFWYIALILMSLVLILSLTRSAWLATLIGTMIVALMYGRRMTVRVLAVLLLGLLILPWVAPAPVWNRLTRFLSPEEISNQMRIWLWTMSLRVVRDYPWLGTGPDQMPYVYPNYRLSAMPADRIPEHFHNNLVQIMVERGLIGLVCWIGWYLSGAQWLLVQSRRATTRMHRMMAVGAFSVWIALGVAGLFEYNFGDSEILMIWLTLPGLVADHA